MQMMAAAIVIVFPQLELPGTQPGELANALVNPDSCTGCHGGYGDYAAKESWEGSMMANAMRDPLFLAALTVANQDAPGSGELCIRCHTPRGWLAGRAIPTDGSALNAGDYEGVQCDFCHRLVEGPNRERYIGNGQFFVSDNTARQGTLTDAVNVPHAWQYSQYLTTSEMCGVCHDVSNPLQNNFAIERTYTEWKNSAFSAENVTCQECHLPKEDNVYASIPPGVPLRTMGRHDLAGGNTWIPQVLAGEYPELDRAAAFQYTEDRARELLQGSAAINVYPGDKFVDVVNEPPGAAIGRNFRMTVRVENLTGHKLPTGYPEGRRSWLEVKVVDSAGRILYQSGAYDPVTATRAADPDLRTYEVRLSSGGQEGFHFVLTDQILQDNRIPPRGFVPTPETQPVGREYPTLNDGTLANWDDAPYNIAIPADAPLGPATVTVTLWYQTASREYIEFLRDENRTDDRGEVMYQLWQKYGQGAPVVMGTAQMNIEIVESTGCECGVQGRQSTPAPVPWLVAIGLIWLSLRRKRRA